RCRCLTAEAEEAVVALMIRVPKVAWFVLAFSCGFIQVRGDDWPQWRGPNRTGQPAAGALVPDKLTSEPKQIWRISIGEGFASPVLADGRLFYFDNQGGKETLHAIRPSDAQELWRAAIDETFQDEQGPPGPRCTPVIDGDRVYAQSGKGELACLQT